MTTFENLTPLRNFVNAEKGQTTSFGGFSKPGFGVVDWKEERERVREEKRDRKGKSRDTTGTAGLSRDQVGPSRDPPPSVTRDRQSLSTIFGNFRPSRDSFAGTNTGAAGESFSFSESRDMDASRDLTNLTQPKTSFKELFQRAMSKSRESGARDSLLLGVSRDRNSILGNHVTGTLVEEDEEGEVEMELTEVQQAGLRQQSGLRNLVERSREEEDQSRVPLSASPVKAEQEDDDGMDFTNVPKASGGSRDVGESARDSLESRDGGGSARDSLESRDSNASVGMDFTNVSLARDMAAVSDTSRDMDFTNVPRSRALSRISEHDSDGMDYTVPSVARIVSEETLIRSGLSPGGSPRVRDVGGVTMDFTNVARAVAVSGRDSRPPSVGFEFAVPSRRVETQDVSSRGEDMSFTNVPGGSGEVEMEFAVPGSSQEMSFTNVPRAERRSSESSVRSESSDTPRGIKRRRVDEEDMDFTGVQNVTGDMSFTGVQRVGDASGMDFTVPVQTARPTVGDTSMDFTAPVTVPRPDTSVMDFTVPVQTQSRPRVSAVHDTSMEFTHPVTTRPDTSVMDFTHPVTARPDSSVMDFTHPISRADTSVMDFTRPVEAADAEQDDGMDFTRPVEHAETEQDDGMDFTHPVAVPRDTSGMDFTRPVEAHQDDEDGMEFTRPIDTDYSSVTRSTATGMDFTRPVPGGVEVGSIQQARLSRDRTSRDYSDYEFTTFGQQLDSSTRLLSRDMRADEIDMERSLEEPLEEPPVERDHVTDSPSQSRERPLSTIAETTEREDSAGNHGNRRSSKHVISGTFGSQYTPGTPGKRPFSELSRDDQEDVSRSREDESAEMDLTEPMSLKHRFELLSTPRKVKTKRAGVAVSRDVAASVSRDVAASGSRAFSRDSVVRGSHDPSSLTMTQFLNMIDMQFMDNFLLPGKRPSKPSNTPLSQYLVNSYLHPHVQLYSWAVEHLRKDIEVRSANFAELDLETLNDVPPIFVDYTSADSGVKLLLNKQFALDKQYYRVEARKSWYEWRKSISMDLYKRLATNRDLLRSDLSIIDADSEVVSTEVAGLRESLGQLNTQLTQLKNLSTDVELKRQVCEDLQDVQQNLMPLVDKLEQLNTTAVQLESEVNQEVQKHDELKTQLMEQQKRLLDNRHIDFSEIEQLQEKLKKVEQRKGLKLVKFEGSSAVFESRDLVMTVASDSNHVTAIAAKPSLSLDKQEAVKLLPLNEVAVAGVTAKWDHVTRFFDALAEIKLAFNCKSHVTEERQFELSIKLLTNKGQNRTDIQVRFPFAEILNYPQMDNCHVTSTCVYGAVAGVNFTSFDRCLEVLLSVK